MEGIVGMPISIGPSDGALTSSQVTPTAGRFSEGLWGNAPVLDGFIRPDKAHMFQELFKNFVLPASGTLAMMTVNGGNLWASYYGNSNTITRNVGLGGGVVLTTDTTDNSQAVLAAQRIATPIGHPFMISTGGPRLWFEATVKLTTVAASLCDFYVGLSDGVIIPAGAVPITDADVLDNTYGHVGFLFKASTGKIDTTYKAGGQTVGTVKASAITPVSATYLNLGMYFDGQVIRFYNNGTLLGDVVSNAVIAGATFPSASYLTPVIALKNFTTTACILTCTGIRVLQEVDAPSGF